MTMDNVLKTGYLKKGSQSNRVSSIFRRENKRWFVFGIRNGNEPFLEYYEREESTFTDPPINSFSLAGCRQITYVLPSRNPTFTFCIVLENRVIELTAFTRADLLDWCNRLETALRHLGLLEHVRGPDDDHVYTDAPFLLRKKKAPTVSDPAISGSDGVHATRFDLIHTSWDDVPGMIPPPPPLPEDVPGMVFQPNIVRNRPQTIAVYNSDEHVLPRMPPRRSSCDDLVLFVEEKDNSSKKRAPVPIPRTRVKRSVTLPSKISKSSAGALQTSDENRDKDEVSPGEKSIDSKLNPISDESSSCDDDDIHGEAGEYETLVDSWSHPSTSDIVLKTGEVVALADKKTAVSLAEAKTDENANTPVFPDRTNHQGRPSTLSTNLSTSFPFPLLQSSPLSPSSDVSDVLNTTSTSSASRTSPSELSELSPSPVEPSRMVIGGAPLLPLPPRVAANAEVSKRTLSECLPEDEEVHKNVRELLKYFDSSSVSGESGSYSHDPYYGYGLYNDNNNPPTNGRPEASSVLSSSVQSCTDDVFQSLEEVFSLDADPVFKPNGAEAGPEYDNIPIQVLKDDTMNKNSPTEDDIPPPLPTRTKPPTIPIQRQRPKTVGVHPMLKSPPLKSPPPKSPPPKLSSTPVNGHVNGDAADPAIPERLPQRSLSFMQQVSPQSGAQSVVPLKQTQVEILRQQIASPDGVPVELRKKDCNGSIAFVDALGVVWIAGWNQRAKPRLHGRFHLGDQLLSINSESITSAVHAHKFIKRCENENLVLVVKSCPNAQVFAIKRQAEGQSLGIKRDGGTAEIIYIDPRGLAAEHGLPTRAMGMDKSHLSTCNWVLTEINNRPLNLFFKRAEIDYMLNAVGKDITIVVQPSDFIKELKKHLKRMKNYKDFLIG